MIEKRYADDDLLALSGIQHFCFCKRQWALIHIERQWEENLRTTEGRFVHERVDDPFLNESRGDVVTSRAVPLVSHSLGLYGVADVVEYVRSGRGMTLPGRDGLWMVTPVEYKRGRPKVDERDEVQLCAQAVCLEEMLGIRVEMADFFYNEIRRRVPLVLTDELREHVATLSEEMHDLFRKGVTPAAESSRHCSLCSLVHVCVPKLTKRHAPVARYIRSHVADACERDA